MAVGRQGSAALSLLVLFALGAAGCKQDGLSQPCMSVTGASQLVTSANALRVEVFDGSVACPALSAIDPLFDKLFGKGEAISLDVKAGSRTFVLTTYSDAAATLLLGRACTTVEVGRGSKLCFDLTVEPVSPIDLMLSDGGPRDGGAADGGHDLSVATLDLATNAEVDLLEPPAPPDLWVECTSPSDCGLDKVCCQNKCLDSKSLSNCGSCGAVCGSPNAAPSCATGSCVLNCETGFDDCDGVKANGCETNLDTSATHCGQCLRGCSTTETLGLVCKDGKCDPSCNPGFASCTQPVAPVMDNGCETATTVSVSNCGGCGNTCTTSANNTSRSCIEPGTCEYTCATGRQDCNAATAPNLDGCECEGSLCCDLGACAVKHDSGTGQNWYDCVARDTFDLVQAQAACAAAGIASCYETFCTSDPTLSKLVCSQGTGSCACWQWAAGPSFVGRIGRVNHNTTTNECFCPSSSSAQWH